MAIHIQNFTEIESKKKLYWSSKMAKNTRGTSKLQANTLDEALLDHRKKTHILQIVSILCLLIHNIVHSNFFSNLENHV